MAAAPHHSEHAHAHAHQQQLHVLDRTESSPEYRHEQLDQLDPDASGADTDTAGSVRNLRPMLARGAACDTCRARKVKCDASRPFCTPCLKSSRGDTSAALARCKYEGVTVAAAREAVAAARGGATTGHAKGRKRKSEMAAAAAAAAAAAVGGDEDMTAASASEQDGTPFSGSEPAPRGMIRAASRSNSGEPDPKRSRGSPWRATAGASNSSGTPQSYRSAQMQDVDSAAPAPAATAAAAGTPSSASRFGAPPPHFIATKDVRISPFPHGGVGAGNSNRHGTPSGLGPEGGSPATGPRNILPPLQHHLPFPSGAPPAPAWPLGAAAEHIEAASAAAAAAAGTSQGYISGGDEPPALSAAPAETGGSYRHQLHHRDQPRPGGAARDGEGYGTVGAAMAAVGGASGAGDGGEDMTAEGYGRDEAASGPAPPPADRGVVNELEVRIADLERQLKRQGELDAAGRSTYDAPSGPPRLPSSSYTFPASAASGPPHGAYSTGPNPNSYTTPFMSYSPSATAFTSAPSGAHGFGAAAAGSPAGYSASGLPLTPGAYPPMQLVPPHAPSPRRGSRSGSPGDERRGLSALSSAAAAAGGGHGHGSESWPEPTPPSHFGPYPALGSGLSRSASPATWIAASPSHLSNLRQSATYLRRGSEPDAYALSSPRGAVLSAIRGEPSQPTTTAHGTGTGSMPTLQPQQHHQPQHGPQGQSGTVVSTPSSGEANASGTTHITTPLLGGSNNSSPQFKAAAGPRRGPGAAGGGSSNGLGSSSQGAGSNHGGGGGAGGTLPAPSAADAAAESASYLLDEFSLTPELYQILHPQYPLSLPPLSTLHHLLTTFFLRATIPSTMLSRAKILQSLVYGPADARWPEEALLHAMCAYAASFVSPDSLAGPHAHQDPIALSSSYLGGFDGGLSGAGLNARRSAYWEVDGDRNPREYHYRHAKRCILEATGGIGMPGYQSSKRRNLLQVLQATILTCYSAYQLANFMDVWLFAGLCTRLSTPLGLNHLSAWDFSTNRSGPLAEDWGQRIRHAKRRDMLGPANYLEEHWERSVTFWMAFTIDRFASAITDLSTSIDEKDITTHLPCLATGPQPDLAIDRVTGLIPALSIASPTFFDETSVPVGSLGAYIRGTVLFGRVINFLQRFARNPCELQTERCSVLKSTAKAQPDFVELDIALSRFKALHSANFFDDDGNGIDMFSVCAYIVPHIATILLHEGFTDRYDRAPTSSLNRCLASAKCVVNAMTILYHSSYDLGGIDPFIPWCWSVTGRSLVRDYATRRFWGVHDEALVSREMAESVLGFHLMCAEKRIPIAQSLADTLKEYLDHPDTLLPIELADSWQTG